MALNREQLKIALRLNENILVNGGPGSGKTTLLVYRIFHQLNATKNSNSKMLCLTFTNEAAKELKSRLWEILSPDSRERLWIGTFHQFGNYLLQHYSHLLGISRESEIIDQEGTTDILRNILLEINKNSNLGRLNDLPRIISRFRGKVNVPDPSELVGISETIGRIMVRYREMKRELRLLDFDDLIELPLNLIKKNPNLKKLLRDTFRFIFIDELQDTSLLQLELLREIMDLGSCKIFAVADQNQLLYEWRDARSETISEFIKNFNASEEFLTLNHRSPQNFVNALNTLINKDSKRLDREFKSTIKDQRGDLFYHKALDPEDEANFVTKDIISEINLQGKKYGDFVILFRMFESMKEIKESLTNSQIPFCVIGDKSLQDSLLAKIIKNSISVIADHPHSKSNLINSLTKFLKEQGANFSEPEVRLQSLESLRNEPISEIFSNIIKKLGIDTIIPKAKLQTHLLIIQKIINIAISEGAKNAGNLSTLLNVEWGRLQNKAQESDKAIRIMTIHQSKGLEFPVVYIMRLEDGILPKKMKGEIRNLEEERRLLFVALSRAKSKIVMSYSEVNEKGYRTQPSRFFEEMNGVDIKKI